MDRLELQTVFETILGSENVYFQAPGKQSMKYPAIKYNLSRMDGKRANNKRYTEETTYNVILIDPDPESQFIKPLLELPYCKFDRAYVADNLNHTSFTIII